MRKLALLVGISVFLVTGGALAAAQEPSVHVDAGQFAMAQWTVVEDGQRVVYFAAGFNRVDANAAYPSTGYVGRAECRKVERGHHTRWVCSGRARPSELTPGDFVVDPALQTARLRVVSEDMEHVIEWAATGDAPQPYLHQHAGTDVGLQVMTSASRSAEATGTAFGQELDAARFGHIFQGAMFDVYSDARFAGGLRLLDNGTLVLRRTLR